MRYGKILKPTVKIILQKMIKAIDRSVILHQYKDTWINQMDGNIAEISQKLPFKKSHFNAMRENGLIFLVEKFFAILCGEGVFLRVLAKR